MLTALPFGPCYIHGVLSKTFICLCYDHGRLAKNALRSQQVGSRFSLRLCHVQVFEFISHSNIN